MSAAHLASYIGREGRLRLKGFGSITVAVKVNDAKEAYGRVRFLVTPVAGDGMAWVEGVTFPGVTFDQDGHPHISN